MQVLRTKIRKFIAEQFEQTPSQDFAKSLLSDVYYLKDFNLQDTRLKNNHLNHSISPTSQ